MDLDYTAEWLPWTIVGGEAVLVALVTWRVLAYYTHPRAKSPLVMGVAVLSLILTMVLFYLLVLDVFVVSNRPDYLAQPLDSIERDVDERTRPALYAYYGIFGLLILGMLGAAIPFSYYYFEEDDTYGFQLSEYGKKTCLALKWWIALSAAVLALFFLGRLAKFGEATLVSALTAPAGSPAEVYTWLLSTRLSWAFCSPPDPSNVRTEAAECWAWQAAGDLVLGAASLGGCLLFVIYGGVGLATLPIHILKAPKSVVVHEEDLYEREQLLSNRYHQIEEKERAHGNGALTRRERRDLQIATQDRRALREERGQLQRSQTHMNRCLNQMGVCKIVLGVFFLLVSLFIAQAVAVSTVDTWLHSAGWRYGFTAAQPRLHPYNGLEQLLRLGCDNGSNHTLLDFAVVFGLAVYVFCCLLYGMYVVGFMGGKIAVRPHRTSRQDMLGAVWLLIWAMLAFWMLLPSWAPLYFTFGCQQQEDLQPCTFSAPAAPSASELFCVPTQSSLLRMLTTLALWPFGLGYFAANLVLVLVFVGVAVWYICNTRASNADAMSSDEEEYDFS